MTDTTKAPETIDAHGHRYVRQAPLTPEEAAASELEALVDQVKAECARNRAQQGDREPTVSGVPKGLAHLAVGG